MIIKHLDNELVLIQSEESVIIVDYAIKREKVDIDIDKNILVFVTHSNKELYANTINLSTNQSFLEKNIKITAYILKRLQIFLVEVESNKILILPNFISNPKLQHDTLKLLLLKYEFNIKNYNILIKDNQVEIKSNIVSVIDNDEFKLNDKNLQLVTGIYHYFNELFENKHHLEYMINYKNKYQQIYKDIDKIIFRQEIFFAYDDVLDNIIKEITHIIISNQKITYKEFTKIFDIHYSLHKKKVKAIIKKVDEQYTILKEQKWVLIIQVYKILHYGMI